MATTNPPLGTLAGTNSVPDNITLRIVVLAHGNRAENDVYLVLGLDTTIGQLKQQIQESLQQHPAPELQRLIYQGRPLLDSSIPLRQILRLDQRAGNSSHVLHLVIRDDAASSRPPDHRSAQHIPPLQPTQGMATQHLPHRPHLHPPPALPNLDHMRIHSQLHNIQHQLHHAQAMNRANQARLQAQQARLQAHGSPNSPAMASGLPPPPQTPHVHPLGPAPQLPIDGTRVEERIGPNGEHIRTTTTNNGTTSMTFRITGINVPNPTDRPSSAPGFSPTATDDPANRSANPLPPNIQIHPQPPHIPAGFPFPPGMQLPLPFPTILPQQIYNPIMAAPPTAAHGQTMAWLLSSPQGPQGIVFALGHGFFSTSPSSTTLPAQLQQPNTHLQPTPTVSATTTQHEPAPGAQRAQLVVRPQDGTPEIRRSDQPAPPQPGARPHPAGQPQPQPAPPARQPQANRNEENPFLNLLLTRGWLFLRLYMFVFVLSESGTWRRIFMLGFAIIFCLLPRQNPFTEAFQAARRHFDTLIGPPQIPERRPQGAAPQGQAREAGRNDGDVNGNNPNQATGRHAQRADGPVPGGPTRQLEARARGETRPQAQAQQQLAMPTPEEAARRLLALQNRRNPNPILDRLYRIEQGLALFFASLIPGLGERHIQAREQARRILEEEERRVREEREQTEAARQAQNGSSRQGPGADDQAGASGSGDKGERKNEGGPLPASWGSSAIVADGGGAEASSSGIDRNPRGDEQGVRPRNTGAQ